MAQSMDVKVKRLSEMETAADKSAKSEGKEKREPKERRPHPVLYTFLITLLSMLLLMGAFILVCRLGSYDADNYFNYRLDPEGYVRGPVLAFLNPEELSREEYYSAELTDLYDQQAINEEEELRLEEWEDALFEQENMLLDKESELEDKLDLLEEWMELRNNSSQVSEGSNDILIVAAAMAAMTPARAAEILVDYDADDAAKFLRHIKTKQLAAIMDAVTALDVTAATNIFNAMLEEQDYDGLDPSELYE